MMIVKGFLSELNEWISLSNLNLRFSSLWPQRELLDLSTIDVILISNYHCMMALPYITERTGFTGTVYATEPTLQIGRYEDTTHGNIIILLLKGDEKVNVSVELICPFWTIDDICGDFKNVRNAATLYSDC